MRNHTPPTQRSPTTSIVTLSLLFIFSLVALSCCATAYVAAVVTVEPVWKGATPAATVTGGWIIPHAQLAPGQPSYAFALRKGDGNFLRSDIGSHRYCQWMGHTAPRGYRSTDVNQRPHMRSVYNAKTDYVFKQFGHHAPNTTKVIVEPRCRFPFVELCGGELFRPGHSQNFTSIEMAKENFPMRVETYDPEKHAIIIVNCGALVPPPPRTQVTPDKVSEPNLIIDVAWIEETASRSDLRAAVVRYGNSMIAPAVQSFVGYTMNFPCERRGNAVASAVFRVQSAHAEIARLSGITARLLSDPAEIGGSKVNYLIEFGFSFEFAMRAHVTAAGYYNLCPKIGKFKLKFGNWCKCTKYIRLCDTTLRAWGTLDCTVKVGVNGTGFMTATPTCTQGGPVGFDGLQGCSTKVPWIAEQLIRGFGYKIHEVQAEIERALTQFANDPAVFDHPLVKGFQQTIRAFWPQNITVSNAFMNETTFTIGTPNIISTAHPDFVNGPRRIRDFPDALIVWGEMGVARANGFEDWLSRVHSGSAISPWWIPPFKSPEFWGHLVDEFKD